MWNYQLERHSRVIKRKQFQKTRIIEVCYNRKQSFSKQLLIAEQIQTLVDTQLAKIILTLGRRIDGAPSGLRMRELCAWRGVACIWRKFCFSPFAGCTIYVPTRKKRGILHPTTCHKIIFLFLISSSRYIHTLFMVLVSLSVFMII